MENHRRTLPGNAVLPIIVGGVHRSAPEQTSNSARSIGTIVGNATPDGRRANIASMVVGNKCLNAQQLRKIFCQMEMGTMYCSSSLH